MRSCTISALALWCLFCIAKELVRSDSYTSASPEHLLKVFQALNLLMQTYVDHVQNAEVMQQERIKRLIRADEVVGIMPSMPITIGGEGERSGGIVRETAHSQPHRLDHPHVSHPLTHSPTRIHTALGELAFCDGHK